MTGWVPKFVSTKALVGEEDVSFSASVENASLSDLQCGFIYTVNGGERQKIECAFDRDSFHALISEFMYEAEYRVTAYIGNGKHIKYSAEFSLRTPQKPAPPSDSHTPAEPDPEDPEDPEPPVYELDIPYSSLSVEVEGGDKIMAVSGTVGFEAIVPEEVDWLGVEVDAQSRTCTLRIDMNATGSPRECEVQFRSTAPEFDCTKALKVTQASYPVHDVHITYSGGKYPNTELYHSVACNFLDMVGEGYNFRRIPSAPDWLALPSVSDIYNPVVYGIWAPKIPEYNGLVSRDTYFVASGSKGTVLVHVIQHSPVEIIDFACPVMKQEAVRLWDINGDSEISFYEAQQASSGFDSLIDEAITSFDEYRFFSSLHSSLNFSGSAIESIKFPCRYVPLPWETFKNCNKLDGLKDYYLSLDCASVFEGCSSLTEVRIVDRDISSRAFKGCSSLKTVNFVFLYNDDFLIKQEAFMGCTSLETFTIPVYVSSVRDRVFSGCSSLRSIYFKSQTPPDFSQTAVEGTHPDLVLYVPASSVDIYKAIWPSSLASRVVGY